MNTLLDAPLSVRIGGTGRIVVTCPNCKGFADDPAHVATKFTMTDGTSHAVPGMWLAARSRRIEREHGVSPIEAGFLALADFAFGCELALKGAI